MLLKVSAAWANKIIDCTIDGILSKCHGRCCKGTAFYPSKSNVVDGLVIGHCSWLGDKGCELPDEDKPVKCLLYPFVINDNHTLVLHGRAITSICQGCYNRGTRAILDTQRHNLELLFGKELMDKMIETVLDKQEDFKFETSYEFDNALEVERLREDQNLPPLPRTTYWRSQ